MNLRDLHYIVSVADLGHFSRAAEANHVSQPTLSGQIAKLEEFLGVTLFERSKRAVRLTPVGAEVVAAARGILQGEDEILRIAQAHKDPLAEPLRIGLIPTIAPHLIPLMTGPLSSEIPGLRAVFIEGITDHLMAQLGDGALDAAVIATEPGDARLLAFDLYDEPFWLALPRGHDLEHRETIALADIDPGEFLFLTEGHCFRDQALAACHTAGGGANDMMATSLETVINLVGAGQGVTLVPALAAGGAWTTDLGVIVRELDDQDARRRVRLVTRRGFPRLALVEAVAGLIRGIVPNTVRVLDDSRSPPPSP